MWKNRVCGKMNSGRKRTLVLHSWCSKMWSLTSPGVVLVVLAQLTGLTFCGSLDLFPPLHKSVRMTGEANNFFISCLPYSSMPGVDSRVMAKELEWRKQLQGGQWVVMGSQNSERVHVEESSNGQGLDLVFRSITAEDGGNYSCRAEIDGQEERRDFELKVIEPISFDWNNKVQAVEEGAAEFLLACNVSGNPEPDVTWNVRGKIVVGKYGKYEVVERGLLIRNVTREDQGSYKCKAQQMKDGITDFKDMVIQLRVQHAPFWPGEQRSEFFGFISGETNLTCEAVAEPAANFTWLDKSYEPVMGGGGDAKAAVTVEGHKSVLTLRIAHDETFGPYTCLAENHLGHLRRTVTLSEGAKPGLPHIKVVSIDPGRVKVQIQENNAEMYLKIVGFRVEIKLKSELWENATVIEFKKNASNLYVIPDLRPKTYYMIRARALNLAGSSDSSNIIILQTNSEEAVRELTMSAATANRGAARGQIVVMFALAISVLRGS